MAEPVLVQIKSSRTAQNSQTILRGEAAHELVFAVVGHIGSGTTETATLLGAALEDPRLPGGPYDVSLLRARDEIVVWAQANGRTVSTDPRDVDHVAALQDLGDEMRATGDHAAVAAALIRRVRLVRAAKQGERELATGVPVVPDGKRRAYILDSIRHPAEVHLLRRLYQSAFALIGVVCDEETRVARLVRKFHNAGEPRARELIRRDAKAPQKHGQRVAEAFHLADAFLDNSADMFLDAKGAKGKRPNPEWDTPEQLARFVKIITHSEIVRPRPEETAMHVAYGAQARSACLSRQVGAALIDHHGNVVATGTNEVPRAGGGVYGSDGDASTGSRNDHRCAYRRRGDDAPFCSNTREQNEIIAEVVDQLKQRGFIEDAATQQLSEELRGSRIGGLLEFSRAVHAEMDALLSAARAGKSTAETRLFVTTFPCHYCARHIVAAGIDEVQYIEPYPKSQALKLHDDSIGIDASAWRPPSHGGTQVLFRPFRGIAPRMYARAFLKDRDLKNDATGTMRVSSPEWGSTWDLGRVSYVQLEALLSKTEHHAG